MIGFESDEAILRKLRERLRGMTNAVLTFGKIREGVAMLPQGKRRSGLEEWLEVEIQARFSGRILPIDEPVADRWGLLAANARAKGKALSIIDGLLAATAIHHNLTIVSHNVNDFRSTQVPVVNPWTPCHWRGFLRAPVYRIGHNLSINGHAVQSGLATENIGRIDGMRQSGKCYTHGSGDTI
jgi:predicted nucleic acid-binding protein